MYKRQAQSRDAVASLCRCQNASGFGVHNSEEPGKRHITQRCIQSYAQVTKATRSVYEMTKDLMSDVAAFIKKLLKEFHRKVQDDDHVEWPRLINQ